jgi:hypothetical protein
LTKSLNKTAIVCVEPLERQKEYCVIYNISYVGFEVLTAVVISSGIYRHVVRRKLTDVSEGHAAFIFSQALLVACFMLVSYLAYPPTLKIEAISSSDTSVAFQGNYIPEDSALQYLLYGCETWSLKLMEEHRLREFENRVLRRIYGPKTNEMIGGWRKLHNEELHNFSSSPNVIRMITILRMR